MFLKCVISSVANHSVIFAVALAFTHTALAWAPQESAIEIDGAEFQLVTIGPGTFSMGSDSGDGDERPVHEVTIDYSFDIGKTEVTVRQFKAFVEATGYETEAKRHGVVRDYPCADHIGYARNRPCQNPAFEQTEDHPIVCVSPNDAKALCKWLSDQTGQHFRLPTEAEWEYACRAGTADDFAGDIHEMAWFDATAGAGPSRVGLRKPNAWGLHDMHGNVWEWCEDVYHWHYRNAPTNGSAATHPDVPADSASRRVLRGGSWCMPGESCRSSFRHAAHRVFRDCGTGFRIVRCGKPAVDAGELTFCLKQKPRNFSERGVTHPPKLKLSIAGIEFSFVRIDPGTFTMGSPFRYVDSYNWTYELPEHEVTIDYSYYMGATEVTIEQFDLFVEDTGYVTEAEKQGWAFDGHGRWHDQILSDWRFHRFVQTDTEPVTHIGWYDAITFCQWLSEKAGRDIRLPSEAEWEYACRAGTTGDFPGNLDEMGWHLYNSINRTHPVAQKKANAWGLYDMHGNVWEWVQDMWHDDCNGAPTDGSAWLEAAGFKRRGVVRGGSFLNPPWLCRSYIRMKTPLGRRVHYNNGFRLAMSLD